LLTGFDKTAIGQEGTGADPKTSTLNGTFQFRKFGDYELLEEIARGGMGVVYKARQVSLERLVAVKMLLFGEYSSQEFIHRFRIEASAAASLQHANIVAIHEVGVYEGQHYFAMDLVDGPDLDHIVRGKPLDARAAARYTKSMAEAIQFAHHRGILHRDLKPSNILIDSNDQPRITDFGLAKLLTGDSNLTVTGQVLGSPNFMPPEQASAERGRMGPPSDVYSLGAILYFALTGRAPFVGQTLAETLHQVLHKEPIPVRLLAPGVPMDLETICLKCLEKEPSKRYPTAQELADELGRYLRDEPIRARPITRHERVHRWCRRNPALTGALAVAAMLFLMVSLGSPLAIVRIRHAQSKAEEALYAANINKAFQAVEAHDIGTIRERLRWIDASPQQRALRGWEWRYLIERSKGDEIAILGQHTSWFADLAVSPSGDQLACISEDGLLVLWDLATGKDLIRTNAHANSLGHQPDWSHHAVTYTPDGGALVTAGEDGAVRLWALQPKLHLLYQTPHLDEPVNRLAISSDGKLLAGQGGGHKVYLWRPSTEGFHLVQTFTTTSVVPFGISFSPDAKSLLVGWVDRPILEYDISDSEQAREPVPRPELLAPFVFSPDGHWLVCAGFGRQVIRRFTWPGLIALPELRVQGGSVDGIAVSSDSRSLAASLSGGPLNSWELTNQQPQIATVYEGHELPASGVAFGQGKGRRTLASISTDKTVRLWEPSEPQRNESVVRIGTPVLAVAISPDNRYLATVINNPSTTSEPKEPKPYTLELREFGTHALVKSVPFGANGLGPRVVFSPDGKQVGASEIAIQEFFEVPSLQSQGTAGRGALIYAPDGSWMAYMKGESIIKRVSLDRPEKVLVTNVPGLQDLALSPDLRTLASSTEFGDICLWDAESGQRLSEPISGHTLRVVSLAFLPDGTKLVSAAWDGLLGIWGIGISRTLEVTRGPNATPLRGHNNAMNRVVVCPEDGTVATCGDDNTVRLWNASLRQEIAVLHAHTDTVTDLAFSHDGEWLASSSIDGTVHLWHARPAQKKLRGP
jgi:WD40 repeat protein/predicted Ser/Thr protein kinase